VQAEFPVAPGTDWRFYRATEVLPPLTIRPLHCLRSPSLLSPLICADQGPVSPVTEVIVGRGGAKIGDGLVEAVDGVDIIRECRLPGFRAMGEKEENRVFAGGKLESVAVDLEFGAGCFQCQLEGIADTAANIFPASFNQPGKGTGSGIEFAHEKVAQRHKGHVGEVKSRVFGIEARFGEVAPAVDGAARLSWEPKIESGISAHFLPSHPP
jgi:hypothetical protein